MGWTSMGKEMLDPKGQSVSFEPPLYMFFPQFDIVSTAKYGLFFLFSF